MIYLTKFRCSITYITFHHVMCLVLIFFIASRLFGYNAGKLRMDERVDLSMSDPDLVPLLIQVPQCHDTCFGVVTYTKRNFIVG